MTGQLVLPLDVRPALDRSDFIGSACNRTALDLIDLWPDWPSPVMAIIGPPACGKSHLASVWAGRADGVQTVALDDLERIVEDVASNPCHLLLDNADGVLDEVLLFHLFNLMKQVGKSLLITSRTPPARWPIKLPDLSSRLATVPIVEIEAPSDDLFVQVMRKHFKDRQVEADENIFDYLLQRSERTFASIASLVDRLDSIALARHVKITKSLAAHAFRNGLLT